VSTREENTYFYFSISTEFKICRHLSCGSDVGTHDANTGTDWSRSTHTDQYLTAPGQDNMSEAMTTNLAYILILCVAFTQNESFIFEIGSQAILFSFRLFGPLYATRLAHRSAFCSVTETARTAMTRTPVIAMCLPASVLSPTS
jgi:hypothetical protein